MNRPILVASASLTLLYALSAAPAAATPQLLTESKKAGMPAQNCQYCHVSKLPKKDSYKPEDLNDRGKWLMTEKDKQNAKGVKADWLKQYPGGKEQK
jgi:hypothetical protein